MSVVQHLAWEASRERQDDWAKEQIWEVEVPAQIASGMDGGTWCILQFLVSF